MSELKELIAQAGSQMEKTVEHLEEALARVRAGKANVKILDGIMVEYYGSPVPLTQVGTLTVPDAKSKSRVMPNMPRSASVTLAVTPLMLSRRASRQTILLRT